MYEPHLGLCIIHDLHQTTKRWWALHSGKLSPPWTQACLLNMSIDSNFYVLKETPMKLWSCTLALHWFSSDLRYFLGSAWGFSNWKCFCLAFLLLRTACWNGTHFNGPQTLCTCLWRPCNHSSLHAARPTVLPINCGGNTAPDLNSMLAWTHTEEGPDILQSEKECWGLTPNTWKVPICLTRAFTELSRKAAMTGPTPRRATRWETTLCPHACATGFPIRPASTDARSGWWRVVPAPDSPSH